MLLCCLPIFFKLTFSRNYFGNTIRVFNRLDPDQDRHFVGPDLGQTVSKGYQQMTTRRWQAKSKDISVESSGYESFHDENQIYQWGHENLNPRVHCSSGKRGSPGVGIFWFPLFRTPMIDSFSHISSNLLILEIQ